MTSVRDTVLTSLRQAGYGSYASYAEPVITALEGRERDISGVLIEYATQRGMDRNEATQAMTQAGLTAPQPQPVMQTMQAGQDVPAQAAGNVNDEVLAALRDVQQTMSGLVAFARRNGYTG